MIVEIEGKLYHITEEGVTTLFDRIENFSLEQYGKLSEPIKILGQAATRAMLSIAQKNEKDQQKKKQFIPERKADPTVHVLHLLIQYIKIGLMHVEARVETDESRIITAIQLQSTSGRHLPADGDTGERQDDGGQTARQYVIEGVPVSPTLHS